MNNDEVHPGLTPWRQIKQYDVYIVNGKNYQVENRGVNGISVFFVGHTLFELAL